LPGSLIEVKLKYRAEKKYLLHEFVVMPAIFHLIITPTGITLERAMQLIKTWRCFLGPRG
jgi:hypothetical protein